MKTPRWTIPFLRALERTGEVQASAEDAGIDKSSAYARRRAHGDFAADWAAAVERFEAEKKRREAEEIAALKAAPPGRTPGPSREGEGMTVVNGQVKRLSKERWGKRKEAIFFDELAASNNIHRSAKAAGVSYNAVLARRLRHPLFAAKWDAVSASSRATIDMHLIEEAKKSFDPEASDLSEVKPRVTIDQAIKISQIGASKSKGGAERDPFVDETADMSKDEVDEVRERIIRKLERLKARDDAKQLAAGWSYDEAHEVMVPPGWVQANPPGNASPEGEASEGPAKSST